MKRFLRPEVRRIFQLFIFVLFFLISMNIIIETSETSSKIFYAVLMVLFLSIACLSEYLEYLSEQAIKALNNECNPAKSVAMYNRLQKFDIFKAYKKRRILYDLLYYAAIQDFETVNQHIEKHKEFFQSTLDARLIMLVTSFIASIHTNKKSQAKKYYLEIINLRNFSEKLKDKKKKVNPLFNWDELEALHYYSGEQFEKACRTYEKCNTTYMNNKEKSQYTYFYYKSLLEIGHIEKANEILCQLNQIKGELPYES